MPASDWAAYERRVFANLWYYRSNYAFVSVALSAYILITSPRLIVALSLLVPLWAYAMFVRKTPIILGGSQRPMTQSEKAVALLIISVLLLLLFGALLPLVTAVALSATIVLVHATLRPPNLKGRISKFGADVRMSMQYGDSGGGAAGRGGFNDLGAVFGGSTGESSTAEDGDGASLAADPEFAGSVSASSTSFGADGLSHRRGGAAATAGASGFVPAFSAMGPGQGPAMPGHVSGSSAGSSGGSASTFSPAQLPRPAHVRND